MCHRDRNLSCFKDTDLGDSFLSWKGGRGDKGALDMKMKCNSDARGMIQPQLR